jgi:hypothetical protein
LILPTQAADISIDESPTPSYVPAYMRTEHGPLDIEEDIAAMTIAQFWDSRMPHVYKPYGGHKENHNDRYLIAALMLEARDADVVYLRQHFVGSMLDKRAEDEIFLNYLPSYKREQAIVSRLRTHANILRARYDK